MNTSIYNYSDLISLIRTTVQAQHVLLQIDILLTHLYIIERATPEGIVVKYISHDLALSLEQCFKKNGISWEDQKQTKEFLLGLKRAIESVKVLKLTIAFQPDSHMVGLFSSRVRIELGAYILLDFTTDRSIMGGAIISFQGVYKNCTLKKRIADVFEKDKDKIWSIIQ